MNVLVISLSCQVTGKMIRIVTIILSSLFIMFFSEQFTRGIGNIFKAGISHWYPEHCKKREERRGWSKDGEGNKQSRRNAGRGRQENDMEEPGVATRASVPQVVRISFVNFSMPIKCVLEHRVPGLHSPVSSLLCPLS